MRHLHLQINKHKKILLFFLILFLGWLLRSYQVAVIPPGLYVDEVSIGVNAASVAATGKDEWGVDRPVLFKAYGEYKLPVYIYLTAFVIKIFGPSDLVVRLPSVVLGTATIAIVFFLTSSLIRFTRIKRFSGKLSLLAMLLTAISPWHLQFSRAGFEATAGLFFATSATLFLLLGLRNRQLWFLILAVISSFLAVLSYLSTRVFLPPLLLIVILLEWRQAIKLWRQVLVCSILAAVVTLFLRESLFSYQSMVRFQSQSVLTLGTDLVGAVSGNLKKMFTFGFLFNNGDPNPRHGLLTSGVLFFWQLPFIIVGGYLLGSKSKKLLFLLVSWLLVAALPVALGNLSPHSLRGLNAVVAWQILAATGVIVLAKSNKTTALLSTVVGFSLLFYLHSYYVHTISAFGDSWGDGIKETVSEVKKRESGYKAIYLHNRINLAYYNWYGANSSLNPDASPLLRGTKKIFFLDDAHWIDRFDQTRLINMITREPGRYLLVVPDQEARFTNLKVKKIFVINKSNKEPGFVGYEIKSP